VDKITAPFTDEQVRALNEYQHSGLFHEYTCGNDSRHRVLVASTEGWSCPDCTYTQNWAHASMAVPLTSEQKRQALAMGGQVSVPDLAIRYNDNGTRDLVSEELGLELKNFKVDSFSFGATTGRHVVAESWQGVAQPDKENP
jgi:hypothetical protein